MAGSALRVVERRDSRLALRALLESYEAMRTIHVILDNVIIPKSRVTLAWLAEHAARLTLHCLPPYCPAENHIERLGLELYANLTRNHRVPAIAELLERVHRDLTARFDIERRVLWAS